MFGQNIRSRAGDALKAAAIGAIFAAGLGGGAAQAASAESINQEVTVAQAELLAIPGAERLYESAAAVLIIPNVTKASAIVGGAYGEGALLIDGAVNSYWSYGAASIGFQIGAQQTRQALFFMTDKALDDFLAAKGFEIGADAEITVLDDGAELAVDTTKDSKPIVAVVYHRGGLHGGVSLQGGKYSYIER